MFSMDTFVIGNNIKIIQGFVGSSYNFSFSKAIVMNIKTAQHNILWKAYQSCGCQFQL